MAKTTKKAAADTVAVYDRSKFTADPAKFYRIHFRNGHSGEYSGQALAVEAPLNWDEVVSVDEIVSTPIESGDVV